MNNDNDLNLHLHHKCRAGFATEKDGLKCLVLWMSYYSPETLCLLHGSISYII